MIENLTAPGKGGFLTRPDFPSPVKIIRVNLDLLKMHMADRGNDNIALFYLRRQERERFHSFRYEKRKVEWLAGRIAAKCAGLLLRNNDDEICHGKNQWHQLRVSAESAGKPFLSWSALESRKQVVSISISHSRQWAIAMAAWENCGIDIQQVTAAVERVEERFVNAGEKNILAEIVSLYGKQAALALLWSAKEAVKKTSAGAILPGFLDISLNSLQKSEDDYRFEVQVKDKESGQKVSQLVWVRLLDGFSYAVTTQNQGRI
ncbi:MAG: 4'-phosphopantetheinyl transferase superfamily protein [Proteobacteria bacterium]|nr:4'-phosphopantetheinyl transferase superfamily protein [Pseudomonadota bacterium]MBU4297888.1 4'-phosphopantetheinyl transferase superfamily protein [Pseudomonadota bacterium]MCG2746008.1 4'-phosphopantetheinyl transferase superfamily protein [Desulfobulbaceae bacterium]